MRLFRVLNKCRHISVLIIPDGNDQTFEYRLNTTLCKFVLVVGLFCVAVAILGTATYWKVVRLAHQAERLQRENDFLWRENAKVVQLQQTLEEMKAVDDRLRRMAGRQVILDEQISSDELIAPGYQVANQYQWNDGIRRIETSKNRDAETETTSTSVRAESSRRTRPTLWPVHGWVTAEFSTGFGPFGKKHAGIDIAAPTDSPVKAAADGIVSFAGWTQELGNLIVLEHDTSFSSRYGHNSRFIINEGEQVRRGQTIAFVGSSGRSTAPHLHFEIWKDGSPVNPRDYLIR